MLISIFWITHVFIIIWGHFGCAPIKRPEQQLVLGKIDFPEDFEIELKVPL
jgi:hypothetical protein